MIFMFYDMYDMCIVYRYLLNHKTHTTSIILNTTTNYILSYKAKIIL